MKIKHIITITIGIILGLTYMTYSSIKESNSMMNFNQPVKPKVLTKTIVLTNKEIESNKEMRLKLSSLFLDISNNYNTCIKNKTNKLNSKYKVFIVNLYKHSQNQDVQNTIAVLLALYFAYQNSLDKVAIYQPISEKIKQFNTSLNTIQINRVKEIKTYEL